VLSENDSAMGRHHPPSGQLRGQTEDGFCAWWKVPGVNPGDEDLEREKGIRWMPWHQEAMKDVARCDKPR
jgi:hypothetical protein